MGGGGGGAQGKGWRCLLYKRTTELGVYLSLFSFFHEVYLYIYIYLNIYIYI